MSNFYADIEEKLAGEEVEAIVIHRKSWSQYSLRTTDEKKARENKFPDAKFDVPITLEEAKPILDYDYDYGGPECHAVYIWTKTRVFVIGEYDGSTWVEAIPRNPESCKPRMVGG